MSGSDTTEAWQTGEGAAHPGTAAGADLFDEWLEQCGVSGVGRLRWCGPPARLVDFLEARRSSLRAFGYRSCSLDGSTACLAVAGRAHRGPLVVHAGAAGDDRLVVTEWLRLGLSRVSLVGIVAADGPARWFGWRPGPDSPANEALALVAEGPPQRSWSCAGRARRARPARDPVAAALARCPRAGPVLNRLAERARRHEVAGAAACRARKWSSAEAPLEAAVGDWLASGVAEAAVRAAVRLAWARARRDVVAADRLVACAEVAASLSGRHAVAASLVAARVTDLWLAARARAWRTRPTLSRTAHPASLRGPLGHELGGGPGGGNVDDELIEVLQAVHHEEEYPAIARVCSVVRERLGASAVAVVALGEPAPLVGSGSAPLATDELVRKAVGTASEISPTPGRSGVEAAVPVRFAGAPVGVLCCRWGANSRVDPQRARTLLNAAANVCAPNLHSLLHRRPVRQDQDQTLGLLGGSAAMSKVRDAIRRAAAVPFPVLVEGESGSGKELVARAIHLASPRQRRQLCAINCAAISDELFEAEVFGHARGAFTGAMTERAGLFEEADGGTLFLDEIGELSLRGQAKLLRVLQEGEVRRLGENLARRVDVRLVAASNRSLEREAAGGRFRDDLRFRLDVVRIAVPPLRERSEDVPLLADHFWRQALERTGGRARLDETTLDVLTRYHWPGNVRELQNLMATLAVRAPSRGRVRPSDLPLHVTAVAPQSTSLDEARRHFDARFVRATLARCGGRRAEAARTLGLSRQGLAKLVSRLGLDSEPP